MGSSPRGLTKGSELFGAQRIYRRHIVTSAWSTVRLGPAFALKLSLREAKPSCIKKVEDTSRPTSATVDGNELSG
jgi:hypothetical protein